MNTILVIASLVSVALAHPGLLEGFDGHVDVTQSSLGNYKYKVHLRDSHQVLRTEERFPDGSVVGQYSVPNEHGVPTLYKYTSGKDGFRIVSSLPVDHVSTPVVHHHAPVVVPGHLPVPVDYTPEVKAARAKFFAEWHQAAAAAHGFRH